MLQILQTRNIDLYKQQIDELGISEFLPNVVEAVDGEEIFGTGIYHIKDEAIIIDFVDSKDDLYLYDGIVRAILFLGMLKGIETAEFKMKDIKNAVKLGFVQNNYNLLCPISEFMSKCKSCGK